MGMTSYAFDDLEWPYCFRETAPKPKAPAVQKSTPRTHETEKSGGATDKACDPDCATICARNQCFTGMVIALPLSLLAWGGILFLIVCLLPD